MERAAARGGSLRGFGEGSARCMGRRCVLGPVRCGEVRRRSRAAASGLARKRFALSFGPRAKLVEAREVEGTVDHAGRAAARAAAAEGFHNGARRFGAGGERDRRAEGRGEELSQGGPRAALRRGCRGAGQSWRCGGLGSVR